MWTWIKRLFGRKVRNVYHGGMYSPRNIDASTAKRMQHGG